MKAVVYLLLALFCPAVFASAVCGPPVGTTALVRAQFTQNDHRPVTCGVDHDCAGLYVTEDGFLHACNPWVKDGQPWDTPQPENWGKSDCADVVGYETWTVGGLQCTSRPPGAVDATFDVMLRAAKHGESRYVFDLWGVAQGKLHARCDDGRFKPDPQFTRCALVAAPSTPVAPKPRKPLAGDAKVGPIPRSR